jgi:hypothetical protein
MRTHMRTHALLLTEKGIGKQRISGQFRIPMANPLTQRVNGRTRGTCRAGRGAGAGRPLSSSGRRPRGRGGGGAAGAGSREVGKRGIRDDGPGGHDDVCKNRESLSANAGHAGMSMTHTTTQPLPRATPYLDVAHTAGQPGNNKRKECTRRRQRKSMRTRRW